MITNTIDGKKTNKEMVDNMYLTLEQALNLSNPHFLICKMGIIITITLQGCNN